MEDKNYRLCPKCVTKNLLFATFCKKCGEPLDTQEPAVKQEICPTCRMPNKSGQWLIEKLDHINESLQKLLEVVSISGPTSKRKLLSPEEMISLSVQRYNEALSSNKDKRENFLNQYEHKKVGILNAEVMEKGDYMDVNFRPEFVPNEQGNLLLVEIDNKPFIFPSFDIDKYHFYSLKSCFDLEKSETASMQRTMVQELKEPATCRQQSSGTWKLEEKGKLVIGS